MAETDNQQPQQEPSDLEKLAQRLEQQNAQAANRLEQQLNNQAAQIQALAEYTANGQKMRNQPPPQPVPTDAGEKIVKQFFDDPVRLFADWGEIQRKQAAEIAQQAVAQYAQASTQNQQQREFWEGFVASNRDVAAFLPQVQHYFQANPNAAANPSAAADESANYVRSLIAQQRADAMEAQKRQEQDARMTTGAPGAAGSQQQRPDEEKEMSPQEAAASAVSEMEDYRASRLVSY